MENYLMHHGILGQKWGVRRYQNKDGSLTKEGKSRYGNDGSKMGSTKSGTKVTKNQENSARSTGLTDTQKKIAKTALIAGATAATAYLAVEGAKSYSDMIRSSAVSKINSAELFLHNAWDRQRMVAASNYADAISDKRTPDEFKRAFKSNHSEAVKREKSVKNTAQQLRNKAVWGSLKDARALAKGTATPYSLADVFGLSVDELIGLDEAIGKRNSR